jgi:hypothetical protein
MYLQDDQVALACEVLKALFNLTRKSGEHEEEEHEEEERGQFVRLTSILHDLLLSETQSSEKQHELHKYVICFNYTTLAQMQGDPNL